MKPGTVVLRPMNCFFWSFLFIIFVLPLATDSWDCGRETPDRGTGVPADAHRELPGGLLL